MFASGQHFPYSTVMFILVWPTSTEFPHPNLKEEQEKRKQFGFSDLPGGSWQPLKKGYKNQFHLWILHWGPSAAKTVSILKLDMAIQDISVGKKGGGEKGISFSFLCLLISRTMKTYWLTTLRDFPLASYLKLYVQHLEVYHSLPRCN